MHRFLKRFLKELQFFSMALGLALPCAAQSQGASASAIEPGRPDPRIVAALPADGRPRICLSGVPKYRQSVVYSYLSRT